MALVVVVLVVVLVKVLSWLHLLRCDNPVSGILNRLGHEKSNVSIVRIRKAKLCFYMEGIKLMNINAGNDNFRVVRRLQ